MNRLAIVILVTCIVAPITRAADHNDPNSVNSIFSDVPVSAADLYDMFGWPADDKSHGDRVVLALTFASVPKAGVFDHDMLYRIRVHADPRVAHGNMLSIDDFLQYADAVGRKYLQWKPAEVRVTTTPDNKARVKFIGFPGGDFSQTVPMNKALVLHSPGGKTINLFIGGRDDAFFNDLPGFFRSINYGPQYYKVKLSASYDDRELKIPKTLLELEGNALFNEDPKDPNWGRPGGTKRNLPPGSHTWTGNRFRKDANGNYHFVYSGKDAQAGRNINAIIVEMPLDYVTSNPQRDRIVNSWGESFVLKASHKIETIPDEPPRSLVGRVYDWFADLFTREDDAAAELAKYKLVDTDGVPFADAALSERHDERQLGANNISLARQFVIRFGHLGWGFGPSVSALGLGTLAVDAFPRVKKCFFQTLNMPDNSWNPKHLNIPLKKPFEIFIPNVEAVDMDTTGTWPFGRRPEDQVATRFLSIFLDQKSGCFGKPCTLETLNDPAVWATLPIEPKTPPNPTHNDKPFLKTFPYLADPW